MIDPFSTILLRKKSDLSDLIDDNQFKVPENNNSFVYIKSQYMYKNGPKALYIPNKILLFKLMIACIGKESPS